jgi:hypothetical protein
MAFCSGMDPKDENRERWETVGTVVAWVVVYFWAVWLFNAFLPDVSEESPVVSYWQQQMITRGGGGLGGSSPAAQEAAEQRAADAWSGF